MLILICVGIGDSSGFPWDLALPFWSHGIIYETGNDLFSTLKVHSSSRRSTAVFGPGKVTGRQFSLLFVSPFGKDPMRSNTVPNLVQPHLPLVALLYDIVTNEGRYEWLPATVSRQVLGCLTRTTPLNVHSDIT